jgi:hypothetical protein
MSTAGYHSNSGDSSLMRLIRRQSAKIATNMVTGSEIAQTRPKGSLAFSVAKIRMTLFHVPLKPALNATRSVMWLQLALKRT